jgi:hypothetical protein
MAFQPLVNNSNPASPTSRIHLPAWNPQHPAQCITHKNKTVVIDVGKLDDLFVRIGAA